MKRRNIPCTRYKFIQTDELRNAYDSFQMLKSAQKKQYVSQAEKYGVNVAQSVNS